jgi:hypothetical protein
MIDWDNPVKGAENGVGTAQGAAAAWQFGYD